MRCVQVSIYYLCRLLSFAALVLNGMVRDELGARSRPVGWLGGELQVSLYLFYNGGS